MSTNAPRPSEEPYRQPYQQQYQQQPQPYQQQYQQHQQSQKQHQQYQQSQEQQEPRVDAGRLWAGGAITALVAALTAVVCVLLVRGVLGISVFAPEGHGAFGNASTGLLAGTAAGAALLATLVLHLLMLMTDSSGRFFTWILTLATLAMILLPFTTTLPLSNKIGTAAVYAVIGLAIGSMLSAVGRGALRRPERR